MPSSLTTLESLKTHTIQIGVFCFSCVLLFRFRSPKAKNVCTKFRQAFCSAVLSDFESTPELLENGLLIRLTGTDILYRSVKCVTTNFSQKYSTEIYFDFDIVATLLAWLGLLVSWYYDVMKDKMSNYPRFKGNAIRIWSIFLLIRVF